MLAIHIDADQVTVSQPEQVQVVAVFHSDSIEEPLVINQAAAGKGELLIKIPLADEYLCLQQAPTEGGMTVTNPQPLLIHFLARIELLCQGCCLRSVCVGLTACQAAGILGIRGVQCRQEQVNVLFVIQFPADAAVNEIFFHGALFPVALVIETGNAEVVMRVVFSAAAFQVRFSVTVFTARQLQLTVAGDGFS